MNDFLTYYCQNPKEFKKICRNISNQFYEDMYQEIYIILHFTKYDIPIKALKYFVARCAINLVSRRGTIGRWYAINGYLIDLELDGKSDFSEFFNPLWNFYSLENIPDEPQSGFEFEYRMQKIESMTFTSEEKRMIELISQTGFITHAQKAQPDIPYSRFRKLQNKIKNA